MRRSAGHTGRDQPSAAQSLGRTARTGVHLMSDDDTRARADERRRMLNELELERNQLIRNIETCRIRDIDRPFIGDWSLKDIVGHVASWEAEFVAGLADIRAGRRPRTDELGGDREESWNAEQVLLKGEIQFW